MATLLHVTGDGHEPLAAFAGHLVRNLEWARYSPEAVDEGVDAVIASPSSPADAVQLVVDLRRAGRVQDVILVSDGSPGWTSVGSALDGVQVVDDLAGLRRALGEQPVHPLRVVHDHKGLEGGDPEVRRHVPRGGTRGLLRERLGDGTGAIGRSMRDFDRELERDGLRDPIDDHQIATTTTLPPATAPAPEPGDPVAGPGQAPVPPAPPARVAPAPPSPRAEADPTSRRTRREVSDPDALVPALLAVSDRLYGVRETGTAVAGHVKEVVGVDAVAVLVPDGAVWTVAGAVGHRHLEERLTVTADHWLVKEVTEVQHGVIVEDTDIARARLAGAPLAAWPHLLACPLTSVHGLVLLARSDNGPAFTSRDLAHASQALGEAGPLFSAAVLVRELARRLRTMAELDDPGFD